MERKGIKTTTYSLDWDTVMNLESRLLRDFQNNKTKDNARALLMISIGVRLGMRVIDNLNLKWEDLLGVQVGERFIRIEKKTDKERILVMSTKLKEVLDIVYCTNFRIIPCSLCIWYFRNLFMWCAFNSSL